MKNIILLIAALATNMVSAQLLESVVMNIGTANEAHYNFYENGLLKDKRKADGTLLMEFIYDDQQRVVTFNTSSFSRNFTYDSQNHITSINGATLYFYEGSGTDPDMYSTDPDITDSDVIFSYYELYDDLTLQYKYTNYMSDPEQMSVTGELYAVVDAENNVQGLWDGEMSERTYRYLSVQNPMRQACLAASRVAYFGSGSSFENALLESQFISENLDLIQGFYLGEDPESFQHLFELNDAGLPVKRYDRFCYMFIPEGNYSVTTTYTYQD